MSRPVAPRYGTADVSLVVPTAIAAVTGRDQALLPLARAPRAVVVLVVDGLGARQLDEHAELAPTLQAAPGTVLDAPFPTTTATSLTSIGTGLPPGRHGIVGYSLALPHDDRPLITLTWSWERQDLDLDARDDVVPEAYQPEPTALELADAAGARAVTVLRPEFTTSGLTRAGLRSPETVPASGLDETLAAALTAAEGTRPTVVYAHHGDLDAIGHLTGPGSEAWCAELARIDDRLAAIAQTLPRGVAVVVTADHGMVGLDPATSFVELADDPDWLHGVRVLTGDPRSRQLHVRDGATTDVAATWRERCGDDADVVTRDEAIAAGWFGPTVDERVRARIGDVLVVARTATAWVHRDRDLFGGRLPGQHGALTADEVAVPARVLQR